MEKRQSTKKRVIVCLHLQQPLVTHLLLKLHSATIVLGKQIVEVYDYSNILGTKLTNIRK